MKKQLSILGGPAASAQINGLTVPVFEVAEQLCLLSKDVGKVLGYRQPSQALSHLRRRYRQELASHVFKAWVRTTGGGRKKTVWLISVEGCETLAGKSFQKNARAVQRQFEALRRQGQLQEEIAMGEKILDLGVLGQQEVGSDAEETVTEQTAPAESVSQEETDVSSLETLPVVGDPVERVEFQNQPVPLFDVRGELYITGEDLGNILGLAEPRNSVHNIFNRHRDELESYSTTAKLTARDGKARAVRLYSQEGCHLISMFARTERAKEVRRDGVNKIFHRHREELESYSTLAATEVEEETDQAPVEEAVPTEVLPVQADPETDTLPVVSDPVKVVEFHGQEVPVYEVNGDLYLTGEDLGKILGLADPRRGVWNIFERHREELDNYTCVIKLMKQHDQKRATRLYSQDGCYLISMFARTDTAKDVRQWLAALPRQVRQALEATPEMLAQMREATIEDLAYRLLTLLSTPAGGKLGIDGMRRLTRLRAAGSMTQKEAGRMFEIPVDAVRLIEKEMAPIMGLEIKPFNRYEENRRVNRDLAKMMAKKIAMDLEATVATPASPRDRKKMH